MRGIHFTSLLLATLSLLGGVHSSIDDSDISTNYSLQRGLQKTRVVSMDGVDVEHPEVPEDDTGSGKGGKGKGGKGKGGKGHGKGHGKGSGGKDSKKGSKKGKKSKKGTNAPSEGHQPSGKCAVVWVGLISIVVQNLTGIFPIIAPTPSSGGSQDNRKYTTELKRRESHQALLLK
jgi:hypothetical protein